MSEQEQLGTPGSIESISWPQDSLRPTSASSRFASVLSRPLVAPLVPKLCLGMYLSSKLRLNFGTANGVGGTTAFPNRVWERGNPHPAATEHRGSSILPRHYFT